jgi:hypothetical protein
MLKGKRLSIVLTIMLVVMLSAAIFAPYGLADDSSSF